ncbi:MAG: sulfatase-like hydrolase/transferase [Acidobacteria bacterium]|nr:sulfatase-like hydrolase/transferase [Acidobacteriota bacterium]MBI3278688.1 sulfatase-like hydrolase/transferase [Acidobacteriota bacterium]
MHYTRRQALSFSAAALAPPSERHNVILVLADDLGYGDIGCYGSELGVTPHLDRLAADGVRFTAHYSCSPVCSPARAALMTGLVPDRTGVTGVLRDAADSTGLSLKCRTLADELRAQGRKTVLIGKWHLGMSEPYWPTRRGFDYFWGFLNGTIDYYTHRSLGGGGTGRRTTYENERPITLDGYYPELATAKAVEFVESNRSQPYFLFLSLALPHTPLQAPEKWVRPFRGRMPDARARYAGMLRCLDDGIGQVRAALERTGQWSQTVIVFASDHGWVKKRTPEVAGAGRNEPFRGGKYELLEGGIRVPCIVYWPGLAKRGSVCTEPTWLADWFPTLTGKQTADGQDLHALLAGRRALQDRDLCWRFADALVHTPLSHAIRRGDWKLLDVGSERGLFDLSHDPAEERNLSGRYPRVVADLERRLTVWTRSINRPL